VTGLGRNQPRASGEVRRPPRPPRQRERRLVDLGDLPGHPWPGEALGPLARRRRHASAAVAIQRQRAKPLTQGDGIAHRHELAVDAVADDVAIAGDVRGDNRRRGRERLRQDHPEALAAEGGGHEHVGAAEELPLRLLRDLTDHLYALWIEQQRLDLLLGRAGDREPGVDAGAMQGLEGP
jgi:hypothetical protein